MLKHWRIFVNQMRPHPNPHHIIAQTFLVMLISHLHPMPLKLASLTTLKCPFVIKVVDQKALPMNSKPMLTSAALQLKMKLLNCITPDSFSFSYNACQKRIVANNLSITTPGKKSPLSDIEDHIVTLILALSDTGHPLTVGQCLPLINSLIQGTTHQQKLIA